MKLRERTSLAKEDNRNQPKLNCILGKILSLAIEMKEKSNIGRRKKRRK